MNANEPTINFKNKQAGKERKLGAYRQKMRSELVELHRRLVAVRPEYFGQTGVYEIV